MQRAMMEERLLCLGYVNKLGYSSIDLIALELINTNEIRHSILLIQ